ncbi:MAG: Na/Pi cotransporter family protein [bacterium]|nr:Na/Pi cotransporter family protein [bacterium]
MNIFSIFTLFGGLAFFLYGMNVMSSGLEKLSGGKLEKMLKSLTSNPFNALALGAGITIAIQSSSALTVMLVGLVNSGIMDLNQTIGIIMGSNIGTTLTAWILSLSGIESNNFFLQLLKPESFSPIIAIFGILLIMASKKDKHKNIGTLMIGFSILMCGMQFMAGAMKPLAGMPQFTNILTAFNNPILGIIVGAIFTGIIQSSAASVGVLQALSMTGGITFGMAIPIIMGQNIGTCVTALISSIGVGTNAKRVSVVHISFNVIGTAVFLLIFYAGHMIFNFSFLESAINPFQIAVCHTIFNIVTTLLLLPFINQLEKIAMTVIKDKNVEAEDIVFLDERLLLTPTFAIKECENLTVKMAIIAKKNFFRALKMLNNFNEKRMEKIQRKEPVIDKYEDKLGTFLVNLSTKNLSDSDSREVSKLLSTIGDIERIGDHAINILKVAKELQEKNIILSDYVKQELLTIIEALSEIMEITIDSICNNDTEKAKMVEPLEQVIDILVSESRESHIKRLQNGQCTLTNGFIYSEILNNIERVSDHCSNIAIYQIQVNQSSFDRHAYLNNVKSFKDADFNKNFDMYKNKYLKVRVQVDI